MKVIVLGSGGWIPTKSSETCSYLVVYKEELLLLDTGTGTSNLRKYVDIINSFNGLNIIYSHYHLDHIAGLSFVIPWVKEHNLKIFGPGKPYYSEGVKGVLENITSPTYHSLPIANFAKNVEFFDYDESGFAIGEISVGINKQKHTAASFGISIEDKLHFATDTTVMDSTFTTASRVKLLLHECWDIRKVRDSLHSSAEEILEIIDDDLNCQIGLIHKNPFWSDVDYSDLFHMIKGKDIFLAEDDMIIDV